MSGAAHGYRFLTRLAAAKAWTGVYESLDLRRAGGLSVRGLRKQAQEARGQACAAHLRPRRREQALPDMMKKARSRGKKCLGCHHFSIGNRNGQNKAALDRHTIKQRGTGTAMPMIAALCDRCQAKAFTQQVKQDDGGWHVLTEKRAIHLQTTGTGIARGVHATSLVERPGTTGAFPSKPDGPEGFPQNASPVLEAGRPSVQDGPLRPAGWAFVPDPAGARSFFMRVLRRIPKSGHAARQATAKRFSRCCDGCPFLAPGTRRHKARHVRPPG